MYGERVDTTSDVMTLAGRLADRDSLNISDWCPIEHALELIGTHSALVLLREAFWGARRFEDLARRAGITEQIAAKRLKQFVDAGIMTKQPYQPAGQRTRNEYVLTEAGIDFMPVVWAMFEWGQRHLPGRNRLRLTHLDCGADASVEVRCAEGHPVPPEELGVKLVRRQRHRDA